MTVPRSLPRLQSGFTLLEAIVALVVFSLGAFALYGWLSTNTITLQRIIARRELAEVRHSALDVMRLVNPMSEPSGRRKIGVIEVQWQAKLLEPAKQGVTQVGLPTLFQIGLYDVDVRILRGSETIDTFDVRQVGYRQVRQLELD